MQQKKRALGKGLSALLPVKPTEPTGKVAVDAPTGTVQTAEGEKILRLPVTAVHPNPKQPRVHFDETSLEELADSIRTHGLIQPIAVIRQNEKYMIVAGERRWRAAQRAGIQEIPTILLTLTDREVLEYALVENLQRENLNTLEEARAYRALMSSFGLSQDEVAERVGKSRPTVANALRLLKLPTEYQDDIEAGRLTAGHARALLSIDSPEQQKLLRDQIVEKALSVREAEQLALSLQNRESRPTKPRLAKEKTAPDPHAQKLREQLMDALACRVSIKTIDHDKGKIEIIYNSLDELERVLSVMGIEN